jgi:Sec-independent protein translocase protein TatA
MKKDILKIAGVKSEKDFYKKYPTEEAFMAEHGGKFKKAAMGKSMVNKQLIQLTDFANPPQAQEGWIGRAASANLNFWEKCAMAQGAGSKGAGMIGFDSKSSKYKNPYEEMSDIKSYSKDERKAFEKSRPQDVELSDWVAFNRDASRMNALLKNPDYSKYTDSTGTLKPEYQNSATQFDPYYLYYKPAFADKTSVTPEDIMKFQQSQPGGISGYKELVNRRYMPKREYGGELSKKAQGGVRISPPNFTQADMNINQQFSAGVGFPNVTQQTMQQMQYNWGTSTPALNIQQPQQPQQDVEVTEIEPRIDANKIQSGLQFTSTLGQNYQKIRGAIEEQKKAKLMRELSPLIARASSTRPEQIERRYVRPEDTVNTGEEMFPIYGVGTNILARNGKMVGGIPGEIANTFAPNTLYDDLGYEPLNDSERYKQFMYGGKMNTAEGGASLGMIQEGVNTAGDIAAFVIDARTRKLNKQSQQFLNQAAFQSGMQGLQQGQYQSYMKDGGSTSPYAWMSHTWQPQLIASFGEHKLKDLLAPPKDADMLRAGGHLKEYTAPSERAMSTERPMMQMGGELQTHWGGYAEPMSYNPYLPEGGETIMFKGQSHEESDGKGNTGIGITYGQNPVEVERGEPAIKMKDGSGGDSSLVVFGNLKIPDMLGDPAAKGKNFKRYVADLSKQEEKQNKLVDKSVTAIDGMDIQTPFDRLAFNSLQSNVMGANMKLKDYAEKKMDASALQTAMNDTIEEFGLKTTNKGNVMAKLGASILKAQSGKALPKLDPKDYDYLKSLYSDAEKQKTGPAVLKFQKEFHRLAGPYAKEVLKSEPATSYGKAKGYAPEDVRSNEDRMFGKRTIQYMTALNNAMEQPVTTEQTNLPEILISGRKPETPVQQQETVETSYKLNPLMNIIGQVLPYLRPSDAEELDPNQLAGEMYAMATNQLEPVRAQLFQPQLGVPYDISLQDILNENEASFRSQQRLMGYNPAAQASLNAQKYSANQRVLGEQFRLNQAMKDQVYRENRNILNQAQLQNLGILDQQYVRQEEAKSKTKATTQAALNSVAAKYAQNKLENRTLQTYENLYNYRYDPRFRAMNMNAPVDFQQMIANASPAELAQYQKTLEEKNKKSSEKKRNGSIVKALKNI